MKKKTTEQTETGIDRERQRLDLISDIPEDAFHGISEEAWRDARVANSILLKNQDRTMGAKGSTWDKLNTRQKQKAHMDFFAGVMKTPEYREALVKEMIARPLEVLKIYVSTIPKEVEMNINQQTAVVILPGKAGNVEEWMKMAKGHKDIDGEVVGELGADAAQTWKNILESE